MNGTSIINTSPDANSYGPSVFFGRLGDSSPSTSSSIQYQQTSQGNISLWDTLKNATKSAVKASTGVGPSVSVAASKGAQALGEGVKSAGAGVAKAANSAGTGIKIGFAILIIVLGIVLFAQVRRVTG